MGLRPRHPEFEERTAWRLLNAFTEMLKGNLKYLPRRTVTVQGMLDLACGSTLPELPPQAEDSAVEVEAAPPLNHAL
jgi:hypothetical protein